MDSGDRLWTAVWTLAASIILALIFTISSCVKQEAELQFKTGQICMEQNGHYMRQVRTTEGVSKTTYTCQFTR